MPELPDIRLYLHALEPRVLGAILEELRILRPFFLRSVDVPPELLAGRRVTSVERLGKRIVLGFEGDYFAVIHLMIAGRFRWAARGGKAPGKIGLAAFGFATGSLLVTEAGTKRRASLHLVRGRQQLVPFERGGLDVEGSSLAEFAAALRRENHTLKRALTDPRILDGVGNAYSDELLHQARLSPLTLTGRLKDEEMDRLWRAARATLSEWTARLIEETGERFPEKVTAFRPEMAVHGRYNLPCPVCGTPVQRIRYAENETNYCPTCQTGGRLLADRALSRLLREDWPRSLEELDELRSPRA
jgi:formamidopyrimidine-DNA glycosylase